MTRVVDSLGYIGAMIATYEQGDVLPVRAFYTDPSIADEGRFERVILEKIYECDYFMPVMTADTVTSPWVCKEISHALTLQKAIIPILVDDYVMDADSLPAELRLLASYNGQRINAKFYDACIDHLVMDILK